MYYKITLLNNFIKVMTVTLLIFLSSVAYSQEKDVNILMMELRDGDQTVRLKAANAIRKMGTSAIEIMIVALKDEEAFVRRGAAVALGQIMDTRAYESLIASLKDEETFVRRDAVVALGQIKDARAVEFLIPALKDEDADARGSAVVALGEIKDARAVEPLILAFKDKDLFVQQSAAVALGQIKDAHAVNVLLTALKDKRLDIIAVVYAFFIRRGKSGTEDILIEALNEYGSADMVEDFLDCGNSKLEEAAYLWAKKNGYTSRHLPSGRGKPVWGQEK